MLGASRSSLAAARTRLAELSQADAGVDLESLSTDLLAVTTLLVQELPLRRALAEGSTPTEAKAALLDGLLAERVSPAALSFLKDVVGSRWSRPGNLVDALETLGVLASFEQALTADALDEVEDELFRFARILEREGELRDLLQNPYQPDERKRSLLTELLGDKVNPVTLRVIVAAATVSVRRRTVGEALDQFSQLAAELRERLNARVTLAVEPSPEQLERLGEELARVFGRTMGLRVEIDPSIVAGAVIRVGDQVLDASVARRLDIARRGLAHTG
ncbi:MAG TPA: F0F1 ATP synthase subunit delta [Mycobacteriales bacterium]|nr:F0F1 ATP synthase subunit delta [Mycobacteriales bacterium]